MIRESDFTSKDVGRRGTSWDVVRVLVGLVLVLAAVSKLHRLLTHDVVAATDWLSSPQSHGIAVGGEIALGVWLLSGEYGQWSRRAAIVVFSAFAVASFARAVAGERSCYCFGVVATTPWLVGAMDVVIVSYLLRHRPNGDWSKPTRAYQRIATAAACAVSLTAGLGMAVAYQPGGQLLAVEGETIELPCSSRTLIEWNGDCIRL
jgi:hypothetical protein